MKLWLKETVPIIKEQVHVEEEFCGTNNVDPSFTWILAVRIVQLKIKFAGYILQFIS